MIDRRLEPHDKNQIELKLGYTLEPNRRNQRYRVEAYTFVSRTLGITPSTYTADHYFRDTAAFIRLKTPTVALASLARDGRASTMFDGLRTRFERLLAGEARVDGTAARSLKLLGCIYKAALRDEGRHVLERMDTLSDGSFDDPARHRETARLVQGFSSDLAGALKRLRHLGKKAEHAAMPAQVREIWRAVDEYVTLSAEELLTRLVDEIDAFRTAQPSAALSEARATLADAAVAAYRYRRGRGYLSHVDADWTEEAREDLPYRRQILKRLISSVLYLDVHHAHPGRVASDVIGMVAAAVAMLFAVIVGIWAQKQWSVFSGAFIGVMVASYIVKDRIKEWGKRYLGGRASRFWPSRLVEVRDASGERVLGLCRETAMLRDPDQIDPEILLLRHADHPTAAAEEGRPEVVIRYVKDIRLSSRKLDQSLQGVDGLSDIIRFNVSHLRQRMDDPDEPYRYVHPETGEVETVMCRRVSHLNLVLRLSTGGRKRRRVLTERVRVVVDQKGIRRIERVEGGLNGSTAHVLATRTNATVKAT